MTQRTNPSVLASSAMNAPRISDHSNYYHEDELAPRHPSAHVHEHAHTHPHSDQRQYEQQHQHQFQARLPAPGLAHTAEAGTGGGGMFYPPSTFAPTRMAAHQYSAAPASEYEENQAQEEYMEPEPPLPSTTPTSAYYASTHANTHASTQSQYAPPPMSSLQSSLHTHAHPHQDTIPVPTSASVPTSGPGHVETTRPPSPTNLAARRHTTSEIGQWKTFATGPFAGRTVRAEIVEVQKADLGRKCADPPTSASSAAAGSGSGSHGGEDGEGTGVGSRKGKEREREREQHDRDLGGEKEKEKDGEGRAVRKDRRPLDPPPVVSLQLFESVHHGTPHQHERAIPAEDVEIGGLICLVDLYRVTIPPSPTEVANLALHAHGHGQTFPSQQGIRSFIWIRIWLQAGIWKSG